MTDEDRRTVRELKAARALLAEFGLVLSGYDPGVSCYLAGQPAARGAGYCGEPADFGAAEWAWLRPLLEELRERRRADPAAPGAWRPKGVAG